MRAMSLLSSNSESLLFTIQGSNLMMPCMMMTMMVVVAVVVVVVVGVGRKGVIVVDDSS